MPAVVLGGMQLDRRKRNREKFKSEDADDLTIAHAAACSAFANFLSRSRDQPVPPDRDDVQGQVTLIAHFAHGIDLAETAIVEGLYPQAATLIRQEHEIISAIEEFGVGKRKDAKTPHATVGVLRDMGRVYGELSGAAHVSHAQMLKDFVVEVIGEKVGPSVVPIYQSDIAKNLYALHVTYVILALRLAAQIQKELNGVDLTETETKLIELSMRILVTSGRIIAAEK